MQILQENALFSGEKLHSWHKLYTTAGRDGRDKSQLWLLIYLRALILIN